MQVAGKLQGATLLPFVGFPASSVLGPDARAVEINRLIGRHDSIFIKPVFNGLGKTGKAGVRPRLGFADRTTRVGAAVLLGAPPRRRKGQCQRRHLRGRGASPLRVRLLDDRQQALPGPNGCVNIDAVIAALLLKMLWQPYQDGELSGAALETAAFTIFLFARMLGCAAEVDDHANRGRNMDTRTPASQCRFVA